MPKAVVPIAAPRPDAACCIKGSKDATPVFCPVIGSTPICCAAEEKAAASVGAKLAIPLLVGSTL